MNLHSLSLIVAMIGDVMTAVLVLLVHEKVLEYKKRGGKERFTRYLRYEGVFGWIGVTLIIVGSLGQLAFP